MSDNYIRKQDVVDEINANADDLEQNGGIPFAQGARAMAIVVERMPSADVAPVVHGHWEYIDDTYCGFEDTDVRCSVCKTTTNIKRFRKTKWCPDCGAKMDGEK